MRSFASSCHFSCIERYLLSSVVHLFLYFHCTWLTVSWSSHNRRLRARSSAFYNDEIRIIIQLKCIKKPLKILDQVSGFLISSYKMMFITTCISILQLWYLSIKKEADDQALRSPPKYYKKWGAFANGTLYFMGIISDPKVPIFTHLY